MIIALSQINPRIGDFDRNCRKIIHSINQARLAAADLVVFSELTVPGYPPKDLLLKPSFIEQNLRAVEDLAQHTQNGPAVLIGFVDRNAAPVGHPLRNAMALLQQGRIEAKCYKSLLPTDDVFDERRYFEPADRAAIVAIETCHGPVPIGVTICEDLWNSGHLATRRVYHRNPIEDFSGSGIRLIVNASASPFAIEKQVFRERLMGGHAANQSTPLVMVGQVGGNDELLFEGASCGFDAGGGLIARAKAFEEDLLIVDFDQPAKARIEPYPESIESVRRALVMGTHDYVEKCGFSEVVLGLSGGIDSAVTAAIAVEALGADRVHAVAMPSRYSSDHSLDDAKTLADNLGIDIQILPINEIHEIYEKQLAPLFHGRPPDITEENIQARTRGNLLMALSNKFGRLLLTTGNKSELAVGYCTLYGDMCGGLAVISDVPKTMVYRLARHINTRGNRAVLPESTLNKPPSAELRPDQNDQQTLPPYETLDAILHEYIELEKSADPIIALGYDAAVVRRVVRMVDRNEYKRKQAATGLKVTSRAFGVGRRMPIAARFG